MQLIDALDTMWIMDLKDEFEDAMPLVANMTFYLPNACPPSVNYIHAVSYYKLLDPIRAVL